MNNMRSLRNNALYIVLLLILGVFLVTTLMRNNDNLPTVDIGRIAQLARDGEIKTITVVGQDLTVDLKDGRQVKSRKEADGSVVETLRNLGVPEEAFGTGLAPSRSSSRRRASGWGLRRCSSLCCRSCCWPVSSSS